MGAELLVPGAIVTGPLLPLRSGVIAKLVTTGGVSEQEGQETRTALKELGPPDNVEPKR